MTLSVRTGDPALRAVVEAVLPPGRVDAASDTAQASFALDRAEGAFRVTHDGEPVASGDLDEAVGALDARIRGFIAEHAPEFVFVHAGVVASDGRALVLPGLTFTGKTELVAALVGAGATYYSDEFAVFDHEGLVHPYAKPLSLRVRGSRRGEDVAAEALGGTAGTEPVPVALIAATRFEEGAEWTPRAGSAADGALALLAHAGQAHGAPGRVFDAVHRAAEHARLLEGPRGEAVPAAAALLAALRG